MTQNTFDIEPGQPWIIDRFQPEDAKSITELFRSVYGEGYPVATYLDPELLIKENQEGRVISCVARIPSGAIIGHASLFNSAPNPRIFESGAGLVHKLYRGGKGISTQVCSHGIKIAQSHPGVDLIYGEPVCNHPYSQKLMTGQNFISSAMEVSLMPAEAYEKEGSAGGRVSTLLAFLPMKPVTSTVYLPQGLEEHFAFCYKGLESERTFEPAKGSPEARKTTMTTQTFDFASVARVAISHMGQEFKSRFQGHEKDLLSKGIRVVQVWLNTGEAWVGQGVETLRDMGYFFGGVLPCWFGTDGLLMQKVLDKPDWEGMALDGERNKTLTDLVRKAWENQT